MSAPETLPDTVQPTLLGAMRVLFVMAVDLEYGPSLRRLFRPLFTGVGPVEAGVATGAALGRLRATNELPDLAVCLGSAGSRRLRRGDVFQVKSVRYRDMDASALGFPRGVTPFLEAPAVFELPCLLPDWPAASLATGASVVSGAAYDDVDADMVDMETFAVLRACQRFGVPMIGLRGVSDGSTELGGLTDWSDDLHLVDERLAAAVRGLEAQLAARPSGWRPEP